MNTKDIRIYEINQGMAVERDLETNQLTLNFHGFKTRITHLEWSQLRDLTNKLQFPELEWPAQTQLILAGTEPF